MLKHFQNQTLISYCIWIDWKHLVLHCHKHENQLFQLKSSPDKMIEFQTYLSHFTWETIEFQTYDLYLNHCTRDNWVSKHITCIWTIAQEMIVIQTNFSPMLHPLCLTQLVTSDLVGRRSSWLSPYPSQWKRFPSPYSFPWQSICVVNTRNINYMRLCMGGNMNVIPSNFQTIHAFHGQIFLIIFIPQKE